MPILRAQVTLPSVNPLEGADVAQNTFHLDAVDTVLATLLQISGDIENIYTDDPPGQTTALGEVLSSEISRVLPCRILLYDLSQPEPRAPIHERLFLMPPVINAPKLPNEVALVVTTRATLVPGVARGRLRGRVYVGPWSQDAADTATGRPGVFYRNLLGKAFANFLSQSTGAFNYTWVVYSAAARDNSNQDIPYEDRPLLAPLASPVTAIEVDDSWDTQRRRGLEPAVRSTYPP